MSQVTRCDNCQYCKLGKSEKNVGLDYYCKITERNVTQSHFGMNSPKCCPRRKVEFECNFNKEYYEEMENTDLPVAACLWLESGWQGVEYNLCFDKHDGTNSSAIYKMNAETEETFSDIYEHYEIDFSDCKWEEKLKNKMEAVAREFWQTEEEEKSMKEITVKKTEILEEEKEKYKRMYAECFPHLAIVADVLKKYGDSGEIVTTGAHIYITPDGYIDMANNSEGWSLTRISRDRKPEITLELKEEIEV